MDAVEKAFRSQAFLQGPHDFVVIHLQLLLAGFKGQLPQEKLVEGLNI